MIAGKAGLVDFVYIDFKRVVDKMGFINVTKLKSVDEIRSSSKSRDKRRKP